MDALKSLVQQNFIEYASYVIKERAIPHVDDGLKPVQRRILHTLYEMDDGKYHKVANIVGRSMQYHPHGDASIESALVVVANKDYFIDRQGNFGNIYTGDSASAARYIECRLTPLALETLFNPKITDMVPSYDGRNKEPVTLPAKLPVLLLQGAEGIAVGMSTTILPHNFIECLEAQIAYLRGQSFEVFPDFLQGGTMDPSAYEEGNGKIRLRAVIELRDEKHLVIREIPFGTTTEKLIQSIEAAIRKGRVKISQIQDYTSEQVEIELAMPRGVYADQVVDALYAFTDCELTHNVQLHVICDGKPKRMTVSEVLKHGTDRLLIILQRELELELSQLTESLHFKSLERIFIENRLYQRIEEEATYEGVIKAVFAGFEPFLPKLVRPLTQEDVEKLLLIRIKRISRFDLNRHRKEMKDIRDRIAEIKKDLSDMIATTIRYIQGVLDRFREGRERRTVIETFERIERQAVAAKTEKLLWEAGSGFLGTQLKEGTPLNCSSFDKILVVHERSFRVIPVPEKLFIGTDVLHVQVVDKQTVFQCIYRDQTSGIAFVKRFRVEKFIMERDYEFVPENGKVLLFHVGNAPVVRAFYVKSPRLRVTQEDVDLNQFLIKGYGAKGNRLSSKPVRRLRVLGSAGEADGSE
jgi:topoisomerase-4 subunit A